MDHIKLVALDMDGTLLQDDQSVSQHTKDMIKKALNQNVQVVLCTGRPLDMCYNYAEALQLNSYLVSCNGAEIWTMNKELIERHPIEAEKVSWLWDLGKQQGLHMWSVATDENFRQSNRPDNFHNHVWLKHGFGNLDTKAKLYLMEKLAYDDTIEVTNSSPNNLEVNKVGVHKANAIQKLCELSEISIQEVMAVGDSMNDFKMLEQVGLGVAVKNAQQEILDIADIVTTSNNDDGVAKAVEKYVLT